MEVSTGVKEPRRRVWFHTRSSFDQNLVAATELRDCQCSQIWSCRLGKATTEHHGIAMGISRFGEWLWLRTRPDLSVLWARYAAWDGNRRLTRRPG